MFMRFYISAGAVLLMLGVAAGAFGAHALRGLLDVHQLEVWQTAVQYQMLHGLGLLLLAALAKSLHPRLASWAAALMLLGCVIFSGSLYTLVLTGSAGLGLITPLGGVLMIVSWLLVCGAALKHGH